MVMLSNMAEMIPEYFGYRFIWTQLSDSSPPKMAATYMYISCLTSKTVWLPCFVLFCLGFSGVEIV